MPDDATNIDLTKTRREVETAHAARGDGTAQGAPVPREYQFDFSYTNSEGVVRVASLRTRIMNADDRIKMARYCTAFATDAGASFNALPAMFQERFHMMAWIMVQLRGMPDWVIDIMGENAEVLRALYEEVLRHERTYFQADGEEGGGAAGGPRVVIRSPHPAPTTKE